MALFDEKLSHEFRIEVIHWFINLSYQEKQIPITLKAETFASRNFHVPKKTQKFLTKTFAFWRFGNIIRGKYFKGRNFREQKVSRAEKKRELFYKNFCVLTFWEHNSRKTLSRFVQKPSFCVKKLSRLCKKVFYSVFHQRESFCSQKFLLLK